jgi:hypothetical protein
MLTRLEEFESLMEMVSINGCLKCLKLITVHGIKYEQEMEELKSTYWICQPSVFNIQTGSDLYHIIVSNKRQLK